MMEVTWHCMHGTRLKLTARKTSLYFEGDMLYAPKAKVVIFLRVQ